MFALLALVDSQGNKPASGWSPSIGKGKEFPLTRHDLGQPWCRMKQFEQTIRRRGCEEKTILNNLCYGQCRSFYIPYGRKTFESCSTCTPVSSKINTVVLNCPQRNPPSRVVKKVKIITYCSCRVCGKTYSWTACSGLQRELRTGQIIDVSLEQRCIISVLLVLNKTHLYITTKQTQILNFWWVFS